MKAIFPVTKTDENGKTHEEMLMFNTETAKKLCDVVNTFGYHVQTIYLSPGGMLFAANDTGNKLETLDQNAARKYIGEKYPDIYEKHFGQVKEA